MEKGACSWGDNDNQSCWAQSIINKNSALGTLSTCDTCLTVCMAGRKMAHLLIHCASEAGADPGGRSPSLKPMKVTSFTMIFTIWKTVATI